MSERQSPDAGVDDGLIYRLRNPSGIGEPTDHMAMKEAANEIERLRTSPPSREETIEECARELEKTILPAMPESVKAHIQACVDFVRALHKGNRYGRVQF